MTTRELIERLQLDIAMEPKVADMKVILSITSYEDTTLRSLESVDVSLLYKQVSLCA